MKVERFAEGGGSVQYRRIEVEGCIRRVGAGDFAEMFCRREEEEKEKKKKELTDKILQPYSEVREKSFVWHHIIR